MLKEKIYSYFPSGIVRASGPDAAEFLQGQFSNDLSMEVGRVVYGLWLDRKGKIVADSFVLREKEDEFLIISYYSPSETIVERLDAYIIMDDVELEIIGKGEALTVWADDFENVFELGAVALPQDGSFSHYAGVFLFSGKRGGAKSLEVISIGGESGAIDSLLERSDFEEISEDAVLKMAILSDKPVWGAGIGASDLPQEVGLGESAVAYNKGCYLGQEVMARIKSMGRVRRQLKPVSVSIEEAHLAESRVFPIVDESGGKAGDYRHLVFSEGKSCGFAMAKSGAWDAGLFAISTGGEKQQIDCVF